MADKKLIIADGHHRYETSVAYAKHRSAQLNLPFNQRDPDEESPSALADDTGHPAPHAALPRSRHDDDLRQHGRPRHHHPPHPPRRHRPRQLLLPRLPHPRLRPLHHHRAPRHRHPETSSAPSTRPPAPPSSPPPPTATTSSPPIPGAIAPLLSALPTRQRQLDVSILHTVLLDHLLGLTPDRIRDTGNIRYIRDAAEAVELVSTGEANIAFLIKPVTLDQLKEISFSGEVMPQKSTDFYPKLLSGLAIYALD